MALVGGANTDLDHSALLTGANSDDVIHSTVIVYVNLAAWGDRQRIASVTSMPTQNPLVSLDRQSIRLGSL